MPTELTGDESEPRTEQISHEDIYERPSPRRMALPCLWDEVDNLISLNSDASQGRLKDAIAERFHTLGHELERRLDARYPECPECGTESLGYDSQGILVCQDHGAVYDETVMEQYKRQHRRVWGERGHGGDGR